MTDTRDPRDDAGTPDPEVLRAVGRTAGARRRRWAARAAWTLVVLALAAGAWVGWERWRRVPPVEYVRETAARGDLTITVTATGGLEPVHRVDVGAEISGRVRAVLVTWNERVTAGQPLAEIDTRQIEAQVLQAEARHRAAQSAVAEADAAIAEAAAALAQSGEEVRSAEAAVREARATRDEARTRRERAERTASDGGSSVQDLEAARAAATRADAGLARAEAARAAAEAGRARAEAGRVRADAARRSAAAQVDAAQAALDADRTTLAKATIRSPIDGVVLSRLVEPGQTVAASFQTPVLFQLAEDLTRMELRADIDEADVGQVAAGQDATFTVDAFPGRRFPARVTELRNAARTVQGVVTYPAVLAVDNAELLLRPGMTATADIVVAQRKDALLVPNGALRFRPPPEPGAPKPPADADRRVTPPDPPHVWVLRDGAPSRVPVTPGPTDGLRTEVTAGDLKPGDAVILDVATPPENGR